MIPKFYFPNKPYAERKTLDPEIEKAFAKGPTSDLGPACEALSIPTIFKSMLFDRIKLQTPSAVSGDKLSRPGFEKWLRDKGVVEQEPKRRLFNLIA